MAVKKLFLNYKKYTDELILKHQKEVEDVNKLGDDYFLIPMRKQNYEMWHDRLGWEEPSPKKELGWVNEANELFQGRIILIDWLKEFLLDSLPLSQVEPISLANNHIFYIVPENLSNHYQFKALGYVNPKEQLWLYQDAIYGIQGQYTDDEQKLLILDFADKERCKFERLKKIFNDKDSEEIIFERQRIPEGVRIAVWRRDQGKCARCGSRENLEYDHIVPVSRGGGNTARNIELLCQNCNRSKTNHIE